MLRRVSVKRPSPLCFPLRRAIPPFVANSSSTNPAEYFSRRLVNLALVPPPENVVTGRLSWLTGPKKMGKQFQPQNWKIIYHGQWQGGNSVTCRGVPNALSQSMVGRRHFSVLPTTMEPGRMQSTLLRKSDSTVETPVMSTFVPSASARKMAASIKKKTSSFTTKEFEQFSPGAVKSNFKDETPGIKIYQYETEAEVLVSGNVERPFLKATKVDANKTPPNISLPNKPKAWAGKNGPEQSPLEATKTKSPPKYKPKDKLLARKEGLTRKGTKVKSKYLSNPLAKKFPYLSNWIKDDPVLFSLKAAMAKSKGETPRSSKLDPRPRREIGSEDKALSSRGAGSLLNGGLVTVEAIKPAQESLVKVHRLTPRVKLTVESQETTDLLFQDLKCTSNPDPPYTPLRYQIDVSSLLKKRRLKPQSINRYWSHQLYESNGDSVEVHYCDTFEKANDIAKLFMKDNMIGFDMEWLSCSTKSDSPRFNASLIQVANESDIALFHVALFERDENELIPQNLRAIIESKDILKIGVNITNDGKRMYEYHNVLPQGLFELSDFENLLIAAKVGKGRIARRLIALSKLVEQYLLLPLRKGPVRMSNWMNPLTSAQIRYAASDAYAGLRVFDAQEKNRKELRPSPPLPACRILVTTTETRGNTQRGKQPNWEFRDQE